MLFRWHCKTKEVEPYSKLARCYDFVMRHVNYERWAQYLEDLFKKAEQPVHSVLDLACGTGNMMLQLHRMSYNTAGFDASRYMVEVAHEKVAKLQTRLPVWQGVMSEFGVKKSFDACICTYDSINYCMDLAQWDGLFRSVSYCLNAGGLFIFDICTEKNSRKYFRDYYERDGREDFEYIRQSHFLGREKIQLNEFTIYIHSEKMAFREVHQQRIYRISEIKSVIPQDFFELVGVFDGFSKRPGTERSNRVHFLLRRI